MDEATRAWVPDNASRRALCSARQGFDAADTCSWPCVTTPARRNRWPRVAPIGFSDDRIGRVLTRQAHRTLRDDVWRRTEFVRGRHGIRHWRNRAPAGQDPPYALATGLERDQVLLIQMLKTLMFVRMYGGTLAD